MPHLKLAFDTALRVGYNVFKLHIWKVDSTSYT